MYGSSVCIITGTDLIDYRLLDFLLICVSVKLYVFLTEDQY
jgi:hypothetical protein